MKNITNEITPQQILHVVNRNFPNNISDKIFSEQPIAAPDYGPWEIRQRIDIYDPRHVMDGDPNINKVLIQRVAYRHYLKKPKGFYIEYCRTLETIREYSYEEWDAGLEVEL